MLWHVLRWYFALPKRPHDAQPWSPRCPLLQRGCREQANGFAAGWEHAGDQDKLHASNTFYDILTLNHSYTSGGSNNGEFWGPPLQVADAVTVRPQSHLNS